MKKYPHGLTLNAVCDAIDAYREQEDDVPEAGMIAAFEILLAAMDKPENALTVQHLKLPPKLENIDVANTWSINAGVDTWNFCIDTVAKLNGSMVEVGITDLHPSTKELVNGFATALAEKLRLSEKKYGWSDGWKDADWKDKCLTDFNHHISKGDPRDVAAYCAFMWYHGWSTNSVPEGDEQ